MGPIPINKANQILQVADRLQQVFAQRASERADAIHVTADIIESHLGKWQADLHQQLEVQLAEWRILGVPPSFIDVAGQSRLEKPFNRLLAWWCDVYAAHGLGGEFLALLAKLCDLPEMVEDIQNNCKLEVCAEQALDEIDSNQEPDLMVRTPRAALLLENKVNAQESGDQYAPYLEILKQWAGDNRKKRAVLCARDKRDRPNGWHKSITHVELAEILHQLASSENATIWGRISATLCALSFEQTQLESLLLQAEQVLERTTGIPTVRKIKALSDVLPLPQIPTPWISHHYE